MKLKKHSVLQSGDTLILDCGYGCREQIEECKVVDVAMLRSLWKDGHYDLCALVRTPNGDTFTTTLIPA